MLKILLLTLLASSVLASVIPRTRNDSSSTGDKLVFCHFMIGITSNRKNASDYDDDMKRAKALNIGVDSYTDTQLQYAYESAAHNDMKVFLSFEFNWYHTGQGSVVGAKIKQYADLPAQLKFDGKVFVSSFAGDGLDVAAMTSAAGTDVFFAPNFHPGQGEEGLRGKLSDYDALMSDPQAIRYIAEFMHRTGLLQQFRHAEVGEQDQEQGSLLRGSGIDVEDDG